MFFPTWWSKLGSFCTSIVGNMLPNCCFQLWTWTTYDHKITETMHMIWFWVFKVFSTENPMVYLTVTLKISLGIKLLNYQKKLWDSFLFRSAPQCWLCFFHPLLCYNIFIGTHLSNTIQLHHYTMADHSTLRLLETSRACLVSFYG